MASKRCKGEGSLREREKGKWEGRYAYRDLNGKQITKSVYAHSKTEAKKKLDEFIKEVEELKNANGFVDNTKLKLSDWLDKWLRDYKQNDLSESTYANYKHIINNHLKPMK